MTTTSDALLDQFFSNADAVIEALGEIFTAHAFIRTVALKKQQVYVDLLALHRDEKSPFEATYRTIDARLRTITPASAVYPMEEATLDTDMFGKVTKSTLYQRLTK
jgi:hypothetical protein